MKGFVFEELSYQNINTNHNELVVYFSRKNYTKKVAFEIANSTGADLLELKVEKNTSGISGFITCFFYGLFQKSMPTFAFEEDLERYEKVTVCTPIWVLGMSAPIRHFIRKASGKLKNVEYVFTHFMDNDFAKVADEMDYILNVQRKSLRTICMKKGIVKKDEVIK